VYGLEFLVNLVSKDPGLINGFFFLCGPALCYLFGTCYVIVG